MEIYSGKRKTGQVKRGSPKFLFKGRKETVLALPKNFNKKGK